VKLYSSIDALSYQSPEEPLVETFILWSPTSGKFAFWLTESFYFGDSSLQGNVAKYSGRHRDMPRPAMRRTIDAAWHINCFA
jgi:hypothetical protein